MDFQQGITQKTAQIVLGTLGRGRIFLDGLGTGNARRLQGGFGRPASNPPGSLVDPGGFLSRSALAPGIVIELTRRAAIHRAAAEEGKVSL